jgi:PAS domain S-box-containing protein
MLLVGAIRLALTRVQTRRTLLWMVVGAFVADFLFIAMQLHLSGGGWWHGATFYVLAVVIAASTVPPRALALITALGAAIYVGKGWLEVTGRWPAPVWSDFPRVDGNIEFLWNYAAFGAIGLSAAALMQLRLVQRIGDAQLRLRTVVDASPYLVMTIDDSGKISAASRVSERITGYDPEQLVGSPISLLVHESETDVLRDVLKRARSGERLRCEFRGVAADGAERWYGIGLSHIATQRDAREVVAMVRDMTDDHRLTEERRVLARELEEARRLELVGRLVSGVAHELNNPLSAILTLAEQMEQEEGATESASDARVIHEQARRARAIVRDLLQVVRAPARNALQTDDLNDTVRRVLAAIMTLADAAQRTLHTSYATEAALFRGEEGAIDQVVTNLIVNALQATSENGRIDITVSTDEARVRIVIRDDGPGFDSTLHAQLFEPFFTTRAPGHGTGLGLAVSRAIVERHGGTIAAQSLHETEGGAQFTVNLPRASAEAAIDELPSAVDATGAPVNDIVTLDAVFARADADAPAVARHVLIIDDESAIRLALSRWFMRRGWTVAQCEDGAQALEVLREQHGDFDLVLCDLKMPGMSGLEVYSALERELPQVLERLVITTGDVRVPVLEKPFALAQLAQVIEMLVPLPGVAVSIATKAESTPVGTG